MPITRQEFESIFPFVRETVLSKAKKYNLPEKEFAWLERSLNYNCLGGKYNRGMSVPDTAEALLGGEKLSGQELKMTATLGWLTELLQAFFLVSDDIMDSSVTRRGQPCWFRNKEVGMVAINDAFLLESGIYQVLREHFRSHPAYIDLVELFRETSWQTELGQLCDLLTAPEDVVDLDRFSLEKWSFIVIYKTAWYSFYLPVALALYYLNLATPSNLEQAERILLPLGEYFQAQDDYLDAFGTPEQIGKIGTDIQDNKCSWLVNQALRRATPEQRSVLNDNYGRKGDAAAEARVKQLWSELELEKVYADFEEERVSSLRKMIDEVDESQGLKKEIFTIFLNRIYKRTK